MNTVIVIHNNCVTSCAWVTIKLKAFGRTGTHHVIFLKVKIEFEMLNEKTTLMIISLQK